jgi:hypothetical protein
MQKFDIDHAHNIVKYFYPEVSEQVVLFPLIKKEMSLEKSKFRNAAGRISNYCKVA